MGWIAAGEYEIALEDGKVRCRNAAGRTLRAVPAKLADDPVVLGLRQLAEWLERHQQECLTQVERWMVRSLPVPAATVAAVWPDRRWRRVLRDLVVTTELGGAPVCGFLRDADPVKGLGLVDLDGDTVRVTDQRIRIPHPALLADLAELREFAVELSVEQQVQQLYREVWHKPSADRDFDGSALSVDDHAGGRFPQLRDLLGRATRLGYRVRGGSAVCPVVEDGLAVEARVWLGDFYDYDEAETGDLGWAGPDGKLLPLERVGPVAWSEGTRMAAALYAGRTIEGEQAA